LQPDPATAHSRRAESLYDCVVACLGRVQEAEASLCALRRELVELSTTDLTSRPSAASELSCAPAPSLKHELGTPSERQSVSVAGTNSLVPFRCADEDDNRLDLSGALTEIVNEEVPASALPKRYSELMSATNFEDQNKNNNALSEMGFQQSVSPTRFFSLKKGKS